MLYTLSKGLCVDNNAHNIIIPTASFYIATNDSCQGWGFHGVFLSLESQIKQNVSSYLLCVCLFYAV